MNCKSMNNSCRSLAIVILLLNALQTADGCRGGEILSELQKKDKKSFFELWTFPGKSFPLESIKRSEIAWTVKTMWWRSTHESLNKPFELESNGNYFFTTIKSCFLMKLKDFQLCFNEVISPKNEKKEVDQIYSATAAGLEPAIFGFEARRIIHYATRPFCILVSQRQNSALELSTIFMSFLELFLASSELNISFDRKSSKLSWMKFFFFFERLLFANFSRWWFMAKRFTFTNRVFFIFPVLTLKAPSFL